MNTSKISLIVVTVAISAACSSSKRGTSSVTSSASVAPTNTGTPVTSGLPSSGVYPPGNQELSAIQLKYKDVTLEKLQEGYRIYTQGACINCHNAENIYVHTEEQWEGIVDDMAKKANISYEEKDAVYKYVLSIKAAQVK